MNKYFSFFLMLNIGAAMSMQRMYTSKVCSLVAVAELCGASRNQMVELFNLIHLKSHLYHTIKGTELIVNHPEIITTRSFFGSNQSSQIIKTMGRTHSYDTAIRTIESTFGTIGITIQQINYNAVENR